MPKISIIINNFNYGRYLGQCIDSVLSQSVLPHELIIVDDGSTDDSREIISRYDSKATLIFKDNEGQASALNAGYYASSGDWIWFIDSDDWLCPHAIETAEKALEPNISRIQGRLKLSTHHNKTIPDSKTPLQTGAALQLLQEHGYIWGPPTSGNIYSRAFLESCLPIPDQQFSISADMYLRFANIRHQNIKSIHSLLGNYRVHGNNLFHAGSKFGLNHIKITNRAKTARGILNLWIDQSMDPECSTHHEYAQRYLPLSYIKDLILDYRLNPATTTSSQLSLKSLVSIGKFKCGQLSSHIQRRYALGGLLFSAYVSISLIKALYYTNSKIT